MKTKQLAVQIPVDALENLEQVADASHMKTNAFIVTALGLLSEIDPQRALSALGDLKTNYPRRGPGRPPARTSSARRNAAQAA